MSLFPQRATNAAFLAEYKKLPDGEGEYDEEVDLLASDHEDDDDDGDDSASDLADFFDPARCEDADGEEKHKAFDASLRQEEQKQLEALAARFEARAAYEYDDRDDLPFDPEIRAAALAAAKSKAKREEQYERALKKEQEAEAERKAAAMAAKQAAMYALFDLESESKGETSRCAVPQQTNTKKRLASEAKASGKAGYRIKKKAKGDCQDATKQAGFPQE